MGKMFFIALSSKSKKFSFLLLNKEGETNTFVLLFNKYCEKIISIVFWKVKVAQSCPTLCDPMFYIEANLKKFQFNHQLPNMHAAAAAAKSLQSCPTPCDPRDGSPPASPIPGILQARILEWVKVKSESEVAQSCPNPSDPMDCSLSGSSIHGIFQARVLEWVAIGVIYSFQD